jgi:uncharacterized protein YgiM (DUF1202 family)
MRKLFLTLIVLGISVVVSAETLYVASLQLKMYSKASKDASIVTTLKRGTSVNVISKDGDWVQISSSSGKGWVQKLFLKDSKPSGSISVLGNKNQTKRINARVRASSDVTAASARGLVADNSTGESRVRMSSDLTTFNPQDLEDIESVEISEAELVEFLRRGKLQ